MGPRYARKDEPFVVVPGSENDYLKEAVRAGAGRRLTGQRRWVLEDIEDVGDAVLQTLALDEGFRARDELTKKYAWAIPTAKAVAAIAALSPIVEIGAGAGYWAKLLRDAGATVAAYDDHSWGGAQRQFWTEVATGGPERVADHVEWTLFLCWPPYRSPMAEQALALHRGAHVVYIGERGGGCTATEAFEVLLEARYEEVETIEIPQWYGIHDYVSVWKKRGGAE